MILPHTRLGDRPLSRWIWLVAVVYFVIGLFLITFINGCTNASLSNGKSSATYRGVKIFSPTVLSLRDGNCAVPSVDAAGVVTEPTVAVQNTIGASGQVAASSCQTSIMTVNGVDVKGLLNFLMTAILGGIAAG